MDCIDLFKRAAMALQTDPRYLALDQARKANDKDEELQNMIGEFNLARLDLNAGLQLINVSINKGVATAKCAGKTIDASKVVVWER